MTSEADRPPSRPLVDQVLVSVPPLVTAVGAVLMRLQPDSYLRKRIVGSLVRRSFEAQERQDAEFTTAMYERDVEVRLSGAEGLGLDERYTGHDGWRKFYDDLYESFVSPKFRVTRVLDGGDSIALEFEFTAQGRASGAQVALTVVTGAQFSARGRIEQQHLFWGGDWEQALSAANLTSG